MKQNAICSGLSRAAAVSALTILLVASGWAAKVETVLHTFQGRPGQYPDSNLVLDAAGNLYGTTSSGGSSACTGGDGGCGVVFKLTRTSSRWVYSILYVFEGVPDGAYPSNLVFDASGNLYGTTSAGGDSKSCVDGCGTVFKLAPASGGWTESVLYRFKGAKDGETPVAGVVFDNAGNLYGTTVNGGTGCRFSCGTVFELSPGSDGGWTEKILHNFHGADGNTDGAYPESGLTIDLSTGNLYGTTSGGGNARYGTVFELSRGSARWKETILHAFQGGSDGQFPANVVFAAPHNLYGTAGPISQDGCGTFFELTPGGGKKVLYRFKCIGKDTGGPGEITLGPAGDVYGATMSETGDLNGTVFKLSRDSGGRWTFNALHHFSGGRDGEAPNGVIPDTTGTHVYGTTFFGGNAPYDDGLGVVFELTP
jgi:uncharacterized repeat protein (TIGR03803 family)